MKVLFIIDTLNVSGAERSLTEIALHLSDYTPVFVHIYKGDMLKDLLENNGVKVYSLNISRKYGFSEAVNKLVPIYENERPDIIHSTLYRSDIIARKLKHKFPNIPLVGSLVSNAYSPLRYKNKSWVMKLKLYMMYLQDLKTSNQVDYFISNSSTIKTAASRKLDLPHSMVEVVHRGRDIRKYSNIDDILVNNTKKDLNLVDKKVILIVGRLIESKGHLDVINALPKIIQRFPDVVLVLAGHGIFRSQIEKRIQELSLNENVKLLGRRSDIPILLALADIFVFPTYSEGLPGALIEAMMAEKIIIASDIKENMECISEDTALLFNPGNVNLIEEKIVFALQNKDELTKMAANAKNKANRDFEINNISNRHEEIYNKLLIPDI